MVRTEERNVRIKTASGLAVDGVVQIRRFAFRRGSASVAFERHTPVAVVVERRGHTERVPLSDGRAAPTWLAWVAAPMLAGVVTSVLRGARKRGA